MVTMVCVFDAYSQDSTFTRTYPCNCDSSIKSVSISGKQLTHYLKGKGVDCIFKDTGIETYKFILIDHSSDSQIINKYKNIRLQTKVSVLCNENGLKIQMLFQESRKGTSLWINTLTTQGRSFAQEIYEKWKANIYNQICK